MSDEDLARRPTRVFLSYAYEDSSEARRVAQSLGDAELNVWFGEWYLNPGDDLDKKIDEAIRGSDKLVVLLSPRSIASPWVRSEVEQALSAQFDRRGVDIIPVLLAPCEIPEDLRVRGVIDLTALDPNGFKKLTERLRQSEAIDFRLLSPHLFDLLVGDLLHRLGFAVEPEWRGLPHRIVDFRATRPYRNPLGEEQHSAWVVEVKFYSHDRPSVEGIRQLAEYLKAAPVDVRGLLVTNGLLTSVAREYLSEDIAIARRLIMLDGNALRRLLAQYPDLVDRYFASGRERSDSAERDS